MKPQESGGKRIPTPPTLFSTSRTGAGITGPAGRNVTPVYKESVVSKVVKAVTKAFETKEAMPPTRIDFINRNKMNK